VVGRLVADEQVGAREHGGRERDAPLLAAAHRAHRLPGVGQADLLQRRLRALAQLPAAQRVHLRHRRVHGLPTGARNMLSKVAGMTPRQLRRLAINPNHARCRHQGIQHPRSL
jgi:hypothetical protein